MNNKTDNKGLVLTLIGALIFAVTFVFVLLPLTESAESLNMQTNAIEQEIITLEMHKAKISEYEAETELSKQYVKQQAAYYPAYVSEEDTIMWVLALEQQANSDFLSISFSEPTSIASFVGYATVDGGEIQTNMSAYSRQSAIDGSMTYTDFKQALDYIYNYDDKTAIDSVNLTYDATTAQLAANMNITKFYLAYPEAEYQPLDIPNVPIGNPNPFGSLLVSSAEDDE